METITYKKIAVMAFPLLFSLLMEHALGITDTIFLGHVGKVEIGASALAGVYFLAFLMIAFGFSIGAQIIIARRNGEGRQYRIGSVLVQSCYFMLALAAALFVLSKCLAPTILRSAITSDAIYDATLAYLDWRIYGFFFAFTALMFRAFFVGITKTRILTVNSLIMVLSNVVLNYGLIFGNFGLPKMGIAGAALGTSIAELISLLFFIIYTKKTVNLRKYGFTHAFTFRPRVLRRIMNLSVWTMVQYFLAVSVWFIFFISIEQMGEDALAISNVVRNVASLSYVVIGAFGATVESLVSNQIGAGAGHQIRHTCWKTIKLGYVVLIPMLLLIFLFPETVFALFMKEHSSHLIDAGIAPLYIMASASLLSMLSHTVYNCVSGTGNAKAAFFMEMATLAVYSGYLIWLVNGKASLAMCWTTEYVYYLTMFVLCFGFLQLTKWRGKQV